MINSDEEVEYIVSKICFFKEQIDRAEKQLKGEDMMILTNNGKTACQSPLIKTIDTFTRNMISLYTVLIKLGVLNGGESIEDEMEEFISRKPR